MYPFILLFWMAPILNIYCCCLIVTPKRANEKAAPTLKAVGHPPLCASNEYVQYVVLSSLLIDA